MFSTNKTLLSVAIATTLLGLAGCQGDTKPAATASAATDKTTTAAPTLSMGDIIYNVYGGYGKADADHRYLDAELHSKDFGTFAERHAKDGKHPYSAEVDDAIDGGNRGKAECKVPSAFNTVWEHATANETSDFTAYGYGTPIAEGAMKKWDINVYPDGEGLPAKGVGMTIAEGEQVYLAYCAMCHGEFAEGAKGYLPLVGGSLDLKANGTQEPNKFRTLGNYWPFITSLHDYIKRAMPFFGPVNDAIGDAGYLGITGFLAFSEGLKYNGGKELTEDTFFDRDTLMAVQKEMPNADNFFCDDRPAVHNTRCMSNCDDALVGDGTGNIHHFTEAVVGPDGKPQYNVLQRPDGVDVAAGVGKSDQ